MKKRFFAMLLVLVLAVYMFVSCGEKKDGQRQKGKRSSVHGYYSLQFPFRQPFLLRDFQDEMQNKAIFAVSFGSRGNAMSFTFSVSSFVTPACIFCVRVLFGNFHSYIFQFSFLIYTKRWQMTLIKQVQKRSCF